jgi:hypothetical protein
MFLGLLLLSLERNLPLPSLGPRLLRLLFQKQTSISPPRQFRFSLSLFMMGNRSRPSSGTPREGQKAVSILMQGLQDKNAFYRSKAAR